MKKILITGGNGDLANAIYNKLVNKYIIEKPDRSKLDVTNKESVENYFINNMFDIVINAAGTLYSSSIIDSNPDLWIRDINVNLIGTYLISRCAVKQNKNVKIINISSTAAFNSYFDWTSYCASKAGVLKLSMGMVKEGYDVIMICPGAIDTKIRENVNINNPNVMDVIEGVEPVINAVDGLYKKGELVFYRKNSIKIINESDVM
ncbi:SDR family oxidoreductase [Aliivibrio fischeri]|uniref:SDR family oxidoreductase n=1 Tax=Aliivibrio fischeri TaxID=668 RepID=UPI0007C4EB72|nr:SDR family oxidoreductase [Aliivibrio fischeri]